MFPSFKIRSNTKELMDNADTDKITFFDCLRDLARINRITFGYRATHRWFRQICTKTRSCEPLSILDVGCGGGDTLRNIFVWARKQRQAVILTGVDLNPLATIYAQTHTLPDYAISFETSNIFDFDLGRRVDFIISSLFTHHLTDAEILQFLGWMDRHARRGWLICDLHRHPLAYFFVKYFSKLGRYHPMVQNDGPLSVARSFKRTEWQKLLTLAGIPINEVKIEWLFPFRLIVTRTKYVDA